MRQEADKLEKGRWYADTMFLDHYATFLKYSHEKDGRHHFSEQKGLQSYRLGKTGFITISSEIFNGLIPTPEDIEKYNLNEEEI